MINNDEIAIDPKTQQLLRDGTRQINEINTKMQLVLQTLMNVHGITDVSEYVVAPDFSKIYKNKQNSDEKTDAKQQ